LFVPQPLFPQPQPLPFQPLHLRDDLLALKGDAVRLFGPGPEIGDGEAAVEVGAEIDCFWGVAVRSWGCRDGRGGEKAKGEREGIGGGGELGIGGAGRGWRILEVECEGSKGNIRIVITGVKI
jgi:hypothetical protein